VVLFVLFVFRFLIPGVGSFALAYILQVFRENMDELEDFLASLEERAFVVSCVLMLSVGE